MCKWVLDMTGETQARPHGADCDRLLMNSRQAQHNSGGLQQCCAEPINMTMLHGMLSMLVLFASSWYQNSSLP